MLARYPPQALTGILTVYLQAQKKIKQMALSQAVIKLQTVPLIILGTWIWGFKGFILVTIVTYVLGLWPLIRQTGLTFLHASLEQKPAQFMQYALFSVLANGISQLGQRGDILILDRFSGNRDEIGYYSLALIFIMAASQVTATVQSVTTPYFSANAQDETWLRRQLATNQMRMALLSVAVAIGVYIVAWVMIPLVYGEDYSLTLGYLAVLLVKYVIWSVSALIGAAIFSLGFVKYNALVVALSTPLSLIASYYLLTKFGVIGVAWAQVISAFVVLFLSLLFMQLVLHKAYR